ncbi:hypothetical protein AAHE18_14G131700 [Arachis hypogaea]
MTNLISYRRSSSTSLIHLFTTAGCSSSPAGVAAANNVVVAAFNKLCDLVAPSLSLPIGKKLLTMEKKGSRRWMSGGSNRSLFPMLWLVPHQMIFLSGIMCWRELKESLLQVDITMERSNFFQIIHSNYLESVCPERWNPMCWVSRETFKKMS